MYKSDHSIMKYISRIAVALILYIACIQQGHATHIVGGTVTYKCLGNNQYEISVTIRRDCFNGDPEAFFDNPASVGIFDNQGVLIRNIGVKGQLLIPLKFNDTLDNIKEDVCALDGTKSVCIHETTYKGVVNLPFREGGYIIEYQRCCRNLPIQNIQAPLEAGASWIVQISEEALKTCNSSPVFKAWSPVFICAGTTFTFDHSATDEDGDSLVYKLWTPFLGASKAFPLPQPPNNPDFKPVAWQAPYSESNMLGGDPFKIDAKTGALYAVPSSLGQYLLGVKVEEYRGGKLLSTVFRDYEVKVIDCTNLVDAKIVAPSLQCDNLTVNFKQESQNPKYVKWFFDYGRNPNAISTESSPTYKYLDTGTYKVALVITRDSSCFDTAFQIVRLKLSKSTVPMFSIKSGECVNGNLKVNMIDLSTGVEVGSKYIWTLKYNGQTITSNEKNPAFTLPNGAVVTAKLEIVLEGGAGCSSSISKFFIASFIQPEYHKDQASACVGDSTAIKFILADSIKGKYTYSWDQSPYIVGGKNSAEPIVSSSTPGSAYIYVSVDNKQGCSSRDSILIIFKAKAKLSYTFINACGSLSIKVKNTSDALTDILWDFGDGSTSVEKEPSHTYAKAGKYTVTLSTKDGCAPLLSKAFTIGDINCLKLTDTLDGCLGKVLNINPKANPNYTYQWRPTNKLSDLNIPNPVFIVDSARTFIADFFDKNTGIGLGSQTITVTTLTSDQLKNLQDTVIACVGDTTTLKFKLGDNTKYTFTWDASSIIVGNKNATDLSLYSSTIQSRFIYISSDNKQGCIIRDSVLVIFKAKPKLSYTFINACGSLSIKVKNSSDALTDISWDFGDGTSSIEKEPSHTYAKAGKYTVTLLTKDGCGTSLSKSFSLGDANCLKLVDTIDACIGAIIKINPKANPGYTYQWRPNTKLSDLNIPNPTYTVDSARTFVGDFFDINTGIGLGSHTIIVRTPIADQVVGIPDTVIACAGQPVALNPKANTALKYEWTPANLLDNATSPNPKATVTVNTVFNVKITNPKDSCSLTDKLVVVLPSKIALDAIPDSIDACNGVPINLNPNGKSDPNLKYKWSPGNVLDDSTKFNPTANITKPTIFTVTITDVRFANCFVTKTIKVNIPVINEANKIKDSVKTCSGIPIALNPTGDPRYKYEWSPAAGLDNPNLANPTATVNQTTIFTAKITDIQRGNCVQSRQTKVIVPAAFTVTPAFRDTTSCTVTAFRLKAGSNNPKVTFEWFDPSGTKVGSNDTVTVSPVQKTIYKVVGTDENGCKRTDSVSVDPAKINIKAVAPGSGLMCQADSMRLQVTGSNPGQVLTYQWTPTEFILSGANTASPVVRPTSKTTFVVKVSNKQGCMASDSVLINVSSFGNITAAANPTTIIIGESSQITSTNLSGYTYKWSPVDGLDNPNIPNPLAKPKKTTTYTLTATNPDGCARTFTVTINVTIPACGEPYVFLPNAFSPNGDGKNDVLYLRSNIVDHMSLIIYDRWGERVFETSNQSVGWDGTFRGKLVDPDVYGYYLTATCIDGKIYTKKGNVTVLR